MSAKPVILTPEEVRRELRSRPGWAGSELRLERVVSPPADRVAALLDQVHRAEEAFNHHAQVEHDPAAGTLTFRLWTHSVGGVTNLDLELAARIDAAVEAAGAT